MGVEEVYSPLTYEPVKNRLEGRLPMTSVLDSVLQAINRQQLPRKVEVGCLRHPGASTIDSQLLDGDRSHGWQIQATQP